MNICAIICEFNPFHNGHKYIIEQAKRLSGCDSVLCIMSASFTQRGELSILNKFERAKHAVLGGADAVLELPTPFAVAPAEIFAQGAIKILSSIPEVTTLAFGCETDEKELFINSANILNEEGENFLTYLNEKLALGESYIKSYNYAFENCGGKKQFLSTPNNVLGVEYTKAILRNNSKIKILPIKRVGSGFNDINLAQNFSSASAIRNNINNKEITANVPAFVYKDLKNFDKEQKKFEDFCLLALLSTSSEKLKRVYGCTEGLENKLKNCTLKGFKNLIEETTVKRYSSSRIKRILCANLLNLNKADTEIYLQNDLYLKPLAIKKHLADKILSSLSKSPYPTVILQKQKAELSFSAKRCFEACEYADKIWDLIFETQTYNFTFIPVEC